MRSISSKSEAALSKGTGGFKASSHEIVSVRQRTEFPQSLNDSQTSLAPHKLVLANPTFTSFIFHQPRAARDQESYQPFLPSPPSPSLPNIATRESRCPRRTQPRDRREFFLQLPPRILERMNLDHLTLKYFSFSPLDVAVDAGLAACVNPSIPYSQIPKSGGKATESSPTAVGNPHPTLFPPSALL